MGLTTESKCKRGADHLINFENNVCGECNQHFSTPHLREFMARFGNHMWRVAEDILQDRYFVRTFSKRLRAVIVLRKEGVVAALEHLPPIFAGLGGVKAIIVGYACH